jgi:ribosomal protein S12 methylthiotransferase
MLMARLTDLGWTLASDSNAAEVIIVNSCGFIESAKKESINTVLNFRSLYSSKTIVLAGCLAVRYESELCESLSEADLIIPSSNAEIISDLLLKEAHIDANTRAVPPCSGSRPLLSLAGSAYIKIAEGCNNNCSFCAIPLIRGTLKSRTIEDITNEFNMLLKRGVKEICLIAQDSAYYGLDTHKKSMLRPLLESLIKTDSHFWIRLLYLHPDHFPFDILPLMQADKRILPYFDIPFQHSSKEVLSAMNRQGDSGKYLNLIEKIRTALPNAVLRSTFLVGFPGESVDDFYDLLDFQKKAELEWVGVFTYSREENTTAYNYKKRPSKKTANERKSMLEENQTPITEKKLDRFINMETEFLIEEEIIGEDGLYIGRSYINAPEVDGSIVIESDKKLELGSLVKGKIKSRAGFDLFTII